MNELLPIRFDFSLMRARWTPLVVTPIHWNFDGRHISLVANVPGRVNRAGNPSSVYIYLENFPPTARPAFEGERLNLLKRAYEAPLTAEEQGEVTVLECLPAGRKTKPRDRDPRKLRDDFFGLKEDTAVLLDFLNHYGAWGDHFIFGHWSRGSDLSKRWETVYTVPPYYFWNYRALLKRRIEEASREPATWFACTIDAPTLQRIPEYPFHCYRIAYAMEAIEASFTFDLLKEVPMSLCAREDCRKPYFVTRKSKTFCSEKCARCMVMRRGRIKKRIEQSEG